MSICNPRDENHNKQRIVDDFLYESNYDPNALTIIYDTCDKIESIKITIKGVNYIFEIIKKLGEGTYGTVSLFRDNLEKVSFAIKSGDNNDEEEISNALKKNGCAVLKTRFLGKKGIMYHCIMELADGDLLDWGESVINTNPSLINPELLLGIAEEIRQQLLCIFNIENDNKYFYYDIKLENILFKCDDQQNLNNYRIMLGDLGSTSPELIDFGTKTYNAYGCTYPAWEKRGDQIFFTKKQKTDALSWEIGVLLLFLSSFLSKDIEQAKNLQKKFIKILYYAPEQKELTASSLQTLQEELNTAYGSKFMNYLNADPNLRPSILLPLKISQSQRKLSSHPQSQHKSVGSLHKFSPKTQGKLSSQFNTIKLKKLTVVQLKDISKKLNCGTIGKRNKESLVKFILECKRNKMQSIHKTTPQSIRKPVQSQHKSIRKLSSPLNTIKLRKLTVVQLKDISKKLNCGPIGKRNKDSLIDFIIDCKRNKPSQPQSQRKPSTPQSIRKPSQPQSQRKPSAPQSQRKPSQPQSQRKPSQPQSQRKVSSQITPSKLNELSLVELKTIAKKVDCKNKQSLIRFIVNCKKTKISQSNPPSILSSRTNFHPNLLYGLSNIGNSCYLDSILLSLFAVKNKFIDRYLFEPLKERPENNLICIPKGSSKNPRVDRQNRIQVQSELLKIKNSIRGKGDVDYCSDLRTIIRNCPHSENFYDNKQKDAGEFLGYLLSIFDTEVAHKKYDIYVTNNISTQVTDINNMMLRNSNLDWDSSIVHNIFSNDLLHIPSNTQTSSLLRIFEDSGKLDKNNYVDGIWKRRVQVLTIVQAPYLIFNLQRNNPELSNPIKTKIIPSRSFIVGGKKLVLSAIVVHEGGISGGHYTAYLKIEKKWYHYNDFGPNIRLIGSYDKLLNAKPSPITNGTLHFYT
jgi:ubiquitin C-terminal hydrolase